MRSASANTDHLRHIDAERNPMRRTVVAHILKLDGNGNPHMIRGGSRIR